MLDMFWVHTVSVQTRTGQNANGDVWSDPVDVPCFVNDQEHMVRGAHDEDVISQTIVYADITNAPLFTIDSIVTTSTKSARVITANANDAGTLPLPAHVEVHLT